MKSSLIKTFLASVLFLIFTCHAHAQNSVVVVPIGNGPTIKPIKTSDVLVKRLYFRETSDVSDLFTTNSTYAYVVTSMHVYFRAGFPANRDVVKVRTRTASSLIRFWCVPNDTYSVIDFGTGYLFDTTSQVDWQIDVFDRGGHSTGIGNEIYVDFYGYRVRK